jgi:hypothetical protein
MNLGVSRLWQVADEEDGLRLQWFAEASGDEHFEPIDDAARWRAELMKGRES